jgi:RNA polymerase sigma-70 factor, ECF subfamily
MRALLCTYSSSFGMNQVAAVPEDAVLIQRTLQRDENAFAELVRRYQGQVWRTVRRVLGNSSEIDDAVQEVFLRAFVSLERFNQAYPFGSWIKRIAANYCIDQLRSRKARPCRLWSELEEHEQERLLQGMSLNGDFESLITGSAEEYQRVALALIDELKPKYRSVFVLREIEGWAYSEIARHLGITETGARGRVCRARAEVQRRFRHHLDGLLKRKAG